MRVWVKNPQVGRRLYVPATLDGDVVRTDGRPSVALPLSTTATWPLDDAEADAPEDLTSLAHAHEPAVLDALQRRFELGEHVTFAGHSVLVALRPAIPMTQPPRALLALVDGALQQLRTPFGRKHQTILISGDSGAGKSSIARAVLAHIGEAVVSQRERVLPLTASLVVLEAFGSARTAANATASRFGKSTKVLFDDDGCLVGCATECYLVDAARITACPESEGTFDVLHQLVHDLSPTEKISLHLLHPMYAFVPTGAPQGRLQDTRAALEACGIACVDGILRVLAAILLLGNLALDDGDACLTDVAAIETLLELPKGSLAVELRLQTPLAVARDALAQGLYKHLVLSLARRLNQNLGPPSATSSTKSIEVCDLFGLDLAPSATHGLVQLCRHYASEKLHQFFVQFTFKLEQRIYAAEKIAAPSLDFHDNQSVLDLLDKQPQCLLSILEHTSAQRHGADSAAFIAVSSNGLYELAPDRFIVRHTGGDVVYDARTFVRDNKNDVPKNLVAIIQACIAAALSSPLEPAPAPVTVAGKFSADIERLCISLCRTEPHFIKCLQPSRTPGTFDAVVVADQLQRLGILDVVRLRQTGYCYRTTFPEFLSQFACLERFLKPLAVPPTDLRLRCEGLLDRLWQHAEMACLPRPETVQLGDRFLFLRKAGIDTIESMQATLQAVVDHDAALLQKHWRGHFVRARFHTLRAAVRTIAMTWRAYKRRNHRPIQSRYEAWKARRTPSARKSVRRNSKPPIADDATHLPLPESPVDAAPVMPLPSTMTLPVAELGSLETSTPGIAEPRAAASSPSVASLQRVASLASSPNATVTATTTSLIIESSAPPSPTMPPLMARTKSLGPSTELTLAIDSTVVVAASPSAQRPRSSSLPPLLLLVLALRVQALYRGFRVRQDMAMVMHILSIKRRIRVTLAAAQKLQSWTRMLRATSFFQRARRAATTLQRWSRRVAQHRAAIKTLAMRLKIQAAARGFLVRNELHRAALDAMAAETSARLRSEVARESSALSRLNASRWCKQPVARNVVVAFEATADVSRIYKPSWAARWADIERTLGKPVVAMGIGEAHSMFLSAQGQLFSVGWNDKGQLGATKAGAIPRTLLEAPVTSLAVGQDHAVALCANGSVYSWGGNKHGQLGLGHLQVASTPTRVSVSQRRVVAIAVGGAHTVALLETGALYGWGHSMGRLPQKVSPPTRFVAVAAGSSFSVALSAGGTLFAWGEGTHGELGLGDQMTRVATPTALAVSIAAKSVLVASVSCGAQHVLALSRCGHTFAWGHNARGQLGLGDVRDRFAPTRLRALDGLAVTSLTAGLHGSVAVVTAKAAVTMSVVYIWGDLGSVAMVPSEIMANGAAVVLGATDKRLAPTKFLQTPAADVPTQVHCAWSSSLSVVWMTFAPHQTYTALVHAPPKFVRPPETPAPRPAPVPPVSPSALPPRLVEPVPMSKRTSIARFLQNPTAETLRQSSHETRASMRPSHIVVPRSSMRQSLVAPPQRLPSKTFFSAINH
ncbi:hypothetical protein SDRG_13814 [Saprolegnia diclina VS20]|uniref:Myosin motor domain-containing protein n=1 Tax=Saprolegnia diclina (strain VS20) TaxID=1156394 RepID=T0Q1T9_SAPDV|nr:hypothetical protein SDRG_13814 [Saprolegnia diclina VS20]EQC28486.1 hypothetical protein SDRG_13814 [Saprolegnia diclina VS20]|eukprot:XP_008618134.1 hypothetical protein SDRG_13814 [Saprolegnia diclina VS20]